MILVVIGNMQYAALALYSIPLRLCPVALLQVPLWSGRNDPGHDLDFTACQFLVLENVAALCTASLAPAYDCWYRTRPVGDHAKDPSCLYSPKHPSYHHQTLRAISGLGEESKLQGGTRHKAHSRP